MNIRSRLLVWVTSAPRFSRLFTIHFGAVLLPHRHLVPTQRLWCLARFVTFCFGVCHVEMMIFDFLHRTMVNGLSGEPGWLIA